jgi:hypothetical protein
MVLVDVVSGNIRRQTRSRKAAPAQASLRLTIKVLDMKYCPGDAELDSLVMRVKFSYRNVGTQAIILYKGSNVISRIMVRRSADRNDALELNSLISYVTDGQTAAFTQKDPPNAFVVLASAETFETETFTRLFVVKGDARPIQGAITSGTHFLQLEVPTWPSAKAEALRLRRIWKRSGFLWYVPITSAPVRFDVPRERAVETCPNSALDMVSFQFPDMHAHGLAQRIEVIAAFHARNNPAAAGFRRPLLQHSRHLHKVLVNEQ